MNETERKQILVQVQNLEEIANGLWNVIDESDVRGLLETAEDLKTICGGV
jgi:hypothetical protein